MCAVAEIRQAMRQFKDVSGFEPPILTAEIGYALARAGKRQEAEREIDRLKEEAKTAYVDPYLISLIYLGLSDEPLTLRWLDKAYRVRSPFLISIPTEPKWKEMLERPELQSFVAKLIPQAQADLPDSPGQD